MGGTIVPKVGNAVDWSVWGFVPAVDTVTFSGCNGTFGGAGFSSIFWSCKFQLAPSVVSGPKVISPPDNKSTCRLTACISASTAFSFSPMSSIPFFCSCISLWSISVFPSEFWIFMEDCFQGSGCFHFTCHPSSNLRVPPVPSKHPHLPVSSLRHVSAFPAARRIAFTYVIARFGQL